VVAVLDDVENFFMKFKIQKTFCHINLTIKFRLSIYVFQNMWPYSKSNQFYAVVGSANKDSHSIDKLSNLADSRRYSRNDIPPFKCYCNPACLLLI
jgi:hypothetical protein